MPYSRVSRELFLLVTRSCSPVMPSSLWSTSASQEINRQICCSWHYKPRLHPEATFCSLVKNANMAGNGWESVPMMRCHLHIASGRIRGKPCHLSHPSLLRAFPAVLWWRLGNTWRDIETETQNTERKCRRTGNKRRRCKLIRNS